MAILRALDGKFYEVPDDQLGGFEVPADELKQKLQDSGDAGPQGPGGPGPGGPGGPGAPGNGLVYVQVYAGGQGGPGGGGPGGEISFFVSSGNSDAFCKTASLSFTPSDSAAKAHRFPPG